MGRQSEGGVKNRDRERGGEGRGGGGGDVWKVGSTLRFAERDGRYSQLSGDDRCLTAEWHARTVGGLQHSKPTPLKDTI